MLHFLRYSVIFFLLILFLICFVFCHCYADSFFPGLARLLGLKEYKFNVYAQDRIRSIFSSKEFCLKRSPKRRSVKLLQGRAKKEDFKNADILNRILKA